MFIAIIIILFVISFIWALWSLRDLSRDKKVSHTIKKELKQSRVIFEGSTVQKNHQEE